MSACQHYKTLIAGTLVQLSAFSTGGRDPHDRVDSPVARDGHGDGPGRLTLRGSGLAGAFIASARRLVGPLPGSVTEDVPSVQAERRRQAREQTPPVELPRLNESVWRFHHGHPDPASPEPVLEVRSGVGIRHDTGAAAEGIKFEVETVPAGTRWTFLLEVDECRDPQGLALPIALHVVEEWQRVCLLGRDVARGLGWMRLQDVKILRLTPADAALWPDARSEPREALMALTGPALSTAEMREIKQTVPLAAPLRLLGLGTIEMGADTDGWGLDTLSLGGSEAMRPLQEDALKGAIADHPGGIDPDLVLAWTHCTGAAGVARPFIPGAGLRGPLRHALSWWQRSRRGATVHDPNTVTGRDALAAKEGKADLDDLEALFGTAAWSGALLLSDAELQGGALPNDAVLLLEQHAEDEFTGGTYGEAKFNRIALTRGRFDFHYLIEAESVQRLGRLKALFDRVAALAALGQVPLGGGKWRGHGWVRWRFAPVAATLAAPQPTQATRASEAKRDHKPKSKQKQKGRKR